jgi:hypothetical protein
MLVAVRSINVSQARTALCGELCGASLQVRKLQAERDWLQEQIEPGSVERPIVIEEPMQLPARPPVRHLSL